MKTIKLTQDQVALVDDEDYERIDAHKWFANWVKNARLFYAMRKSLMDDGKRCTILMHREVLGAMKGSDVDHINHDTLDNRQGNLRVCTRGQNLANQRIGINNTSGFKGVSWHNDAGKWQAYLNVNSKRRYLGNFPTAIEAALAYDREASKTFGEFALTNEKLGLIMTRDHQDELIGCVLPGPVI